MKFLIDECLPTELVNEAMTKGHTAQYVGWIGKQSEKDWNLAPFAIENNLIVVTNNSKDFRGTSEKPGFTTKEELHPGLICLNCEPEKRNKNMFITLFRLALNQLGNSDDFINKVLEVTQHGGDVDINLYEAPILN